ncbi:hypothetical protein [Streptomyces mirabilis]|uniref:hypothetical protein n=1 Tax=Streptomyces mirabilis TaxID=68239 RepID=UPI0015A5D277|nr:hypothetical protein [Streptomyces mirabilis]
MELRELVEGGVLLTSRAREAGWARRSLLRALGREGWTRVQAGAWIEPGRDADFATRLRAVQLLKPRLVVSHRSATALWRIETLTPMAEGTLEFIDPDLTLRSGGKGVLVHRMPLDEGDVVRCEGLRVTGADRTLADLLRAGPRDEALVAVESALTWRRVGGVRRAPVTTAALVSLALEAPLRGAEGGRRRLKLADPGSGPPRRPSRACACTTRAFGPRARPNSVRPTAAAAIWTSCSEPRGWPSRSRGTPTTAHASRTAGMSPASTRYSSARRCFFSSATPPRTSSTVPR